MLNDDDTRPNDDALLTEDARQISAEDLLRVTDRWDKADEEGRAALWEEMNDTADCAEDADEVSNAVLWAALEVLVPDRGPDSPPYSLYAEIATRAAYLAGARAWQVMFEAACSAGDLEVGHGARFAAAWAAGEAAMVAHVRAADGMDWFEDDVLVLPR